MRITRHLILFSAIATHYQLAQAQGPGDAQGGPLQPSPWQLKVGQGLDQDGFRLPRHAGWLGEHAEAARDATVQPYVGIGYSEAMPRTGWRLSADVGLLGQSPRSAVRFGTATGAGPTVDDLLRELRMSPVIQFGASYSF